MATTSSSVVSVMMPAYNAAAHIAEAIESVIAQTHTHWRLVIVDDGSTDETAAVAARYDDSRITVVRRANGGEGAARNTALEHMTGTYLAFVDADDAWLPEHLATAVTHLDARPADVGVYSDGYHITEAGRRLKPLSARRRGPMIGRIFDEVVRGSDVFGPPVCVVLRMEPVGRHQLRFDESLPIGTDWDFLCRVAHLGTFRYVDCITCLYRVHQSNVTARVGQDRRARALAACRVNAINHPAFGTCPEDVRANVFHDLLTVQLRDDPERQDAVLGWPQFTSLSRPQQARLLRLTASMAILQGTSATVVRQWLRRSRQAHGGDVRGLLVAVLHGISPSVCRAVLRWRTRGKADARSTPPFADLGVGQTSLTN